MNAYSQKTREFKDCIMHTQNIRCLEHGLAFGDVDETGRKIVDLI